MTAEEENEVEQFADYIFDYWRIAHTPLPPISCKEMKQIGEKFQEGLLKGLGVEEEKQ